MVGALKLCSGQSSQTDGVILLHIEHTNALSAYDSFIQDACDFTYSFFLTTHIIICVLTYVCKEKASAYWRRSAQQKLYNNRTVIVMFLLSKQV